jgi:hypothetical protein
MGFVDIQRCFYKVMEMEKLKAYSVSFRYSEFMAYQDVVQV